jgi:hypothetical protein
MPDATPPADRYPLPDPKDWRRFLDQVEVTVSALVAGGSAPEPFERLTAAQFAAAKLAAATHVLLLSRTTDRRVDALATLAARAWHRASWGFSDPLLAVPRFPGSRGADIDQTILHAAIVKLIAELVTEDMTIGAAAEAVRVELQAQRAPQVPDVRTLESWHRQATQEPDSHLAKLYAWYRPRPWPPSAGTTLAERLRWVIGP